MLPLSHATDGGGALARARFGDVMAAVAARNGWAGRVITA